MSTVWNIRGTHGAGKTHLARRFLPLDLQNQAQHVTLGTHKTKPVLGYLRRDLGLGSVLVVGPYHMMSGGLDRLSTVPLQHTSIERALEIGADHVIAEGIFASVSFGSWLPLVSRVRAGGHRFVFCYLNTTLEECKVRIRARQEGLPQRKEVNWAGVEAQYNATRVTRRKARAAGLDVLDLSPGHEYEQLCSAMVEASAR
jgi:hypothetical protein